MQGRAGYPHRGEACRRMSAGTTKSLQKGDAAGSVPGARGGVCVGAKGGLHEGHPNSKKGRQACCEEMVL